MNVRGEACSVSKTQPRTGGNGICVGRGADGTRHGEKMLGLVLQGRRCACREPVSGCGGVVMASPHEVVAAGVCCRRPGTPLATWRRRRGEVGCDALERSQ